MPLPIKELAQYPYYTLLEVGNHKLTPVEWQFEEDAEEEEQEEDLKNNKDIFVGEETQKLQAEEITKLKGELRPEELIGTIVSNNEQFSKRTEYSK
jgi:hypothetical protein